jgi:hypothetical protein
MTESIVTLDVREDIRAGRDAFTRIMQAVAKLQGSQSLRLLDRQGFWHQPRPIESGDWEVLFSRRAASEGISDAKR